MTSNVTLRGKRKQKEKAGKYPTLTHERKNVSKGPGRRSLTSTLINQGEGHAVEGMCHKGAERSRRLWFGVTLCYLIAKVKEARRDYGRNATKHIK